MSDSEIPSVRHRIASDTTSDLQLNEAIEVVEEVEPELAADSDFDPATTLAERSKELKRLSEIREREREGAEELQQLRTRLDELSTLAIRATKLASALARLDALKDVPSIARDEVIPVRQKVQKLALNIQRNGITPLLAKKALESLSAEEALLSIERRALGGWSAYVQAGTDSGGLETILNKYPGYREAAAPIAEMRTQLAEYANRLPNTDEAILTVARLRTELTRAVKRAVKDQGLSNHIVDFLGRAVAGVPLTEVLGDAEILGWLRDRDHASAFKLLPK